MVSTTVAFMRWKSVLFWTWCLPQTLFGLLISLILRPRTIATSYYNGATVVHVRSHAFAGMALGKYIFLGIPTTHTLAHEYGHTRQNFYLGPLYLLCIGLPSVLLALLTHRSHYVRIHYFSFFPERWADQLGGVRRSSVRSVTKK
jgi:hypothetical protein